MSNYTQKTAYDITLSNPKDYEFFARGLGIFCQTDKVELMRRGDRVYVVIESNLSNPLSRAEMLAGVFAKTLHPQETKVVTSIDPDLIPDEQDPTDPELFSGGQFVQVGDRIEPLQGAVISSGRSGDASPAYIALADVMKKASRNPFFILVGAISEGSRHLFQDVNFINHGEDLAPRGAIKWAYSELEHRKANQSKRPKNQRPILLAESTCLHDDDETADMLHEITATGYEFGVFTYTAHHDDTPACLEATRRWVESMRKEREEGQQEEQDLPAPSLKPDIPFYQASVSKEGELRITKFTRGRSVFMPLS